MATVTVGGAGAQNSLPKSQVLVTTLLNLSQLAGSIASLAMQGINADTTPGAVSIIGGTSKTNGNQTIASISPTLAGIVVENTGKTTLSNINGPSNETIYSGIGGLTFYDYNSHDTIVTGGGINNIYFTATSSNGLFAGDGNNTVNVASTVSGGVTTIVGTSASSDTIIGSTTRGGDIRYVSSAKAAAFIDPGAANATVIGAAGSTETVSVFGGGPAFTGSLTVISGNGYFQGGSAGGNVIGSDTVGSTTMIGGGAGDVLTSNGVGDIVIGGLGAETLQGISSLGGVSFYASVPGGNSATTIIVHPLNQSIAGANSIIGGNPGIDGWTSGKEKVIINDFVSGTDKLVLIKADIGGVASSVSGVSNNVSYTTVTTTNGSTFTFNGVTLHNGDILTK